MEPMNEEPEIGVLPEPGPMQFVVQQIQAPSGENLLAINIYTPYGRAIYIMTAAHARNVATMIDAEAETAMSGGTQLLLPEEWVDEHLMERIEIKPDRCVKAGKPHKIHKWENDELTGTGYYLCRGNW